MSHRAKVSEKTVQNLQTNQGIQRGLPVPLPSANKRTILCPDTSQKFDKNSSSGRYCAYHFVVPGSRFTEEPSDSHLHPKKNLLTAHVDGEDCVIFDTAGWYTTRRARVLRPAEPWSSRSGCVESDNMVTSPEKGISRYILDERMHCRPRGLSRGPLR